MESPKRPVAPLSLRDDSGIIFEEDFNDGRGFNHAG